MAAGAIEAAVAAMRAHPTAVRVQQAAPMAVFYVCSGLDDASAARWRQAAEAGAIDAVVTAMTQHRSGWGNVQLNGCVLLGNVYFGDDDAATACWQRAVEAGAVEATLAAMRGYPRAAGFQQMGLTLLHNVAAFTPSGLLRCNDGGAKAVAMSARNTHLNNEDVTRQADTVIGLLA